MAIDLSQHPCFNESIKHQYARIHLPVAPQCNIQCNFCNRQYDCVNESRPGVTSNILTPPQALHYLKKMMPVDHRIKVVGIAGPGDPFANPDNTMETLRLVRREYPDMILCVASNGLAVTPYVKEMAELQVSHVTITCCAVKAELAAQIYSWVRDNRRVYRGLEAGQLMLDRQLEAITALKAAGIMVKVNMIIVPGVNENHVSELASTMSDMGVDILNCMAMCHVPDTPFETIVPPCDDEMNAIRTLAGQSLPQMRHCSRCRADAVGLLGEDLSPEALNNLTEAANGLLNPCENRPYVAVASHEGMLVNQHLGEAKEIWIYGPAENGYHLIEKRPTPQAGQGEQRWEKLADMLNDCQALLVGESGPSPRKILERNGLKVYRTEGMIRYALETIYRGGRIPVCSTGFKCGSGCSGSGGGCG